MIVIPSGARRRPSRGTVGRSAESRDLGFPKAPRQIQGIPANAPTEWGPAHPLLPRRGRIRPVASPPNTPPPPSPSRWRDWWKFPLFFGVIAGAILLEVYLNSKGGVLLLLLLAYVVIRGVLALTRKR